MWYFNKEADALTNIAMDAKTSKHVLPTGMLKLLLRRTAVVDSLQADYNQWIDTHPDQADSGQAFIYMGALYLGRICWHPEAAGASNGI